MASSSPCDAPAIPTKLVNLMHEFCASQAMFAACDLGIFDALHEAKEPQSAKQLSQKLSTDENATSRLLDVLVNIELLEKQAGSGAEEPLYTNKKDTEWLTKSFPLNMKELCLCLMNASYPMFGNLSSAVRDGNSKWQKTFEESETEDTYACWYANEEKKINFLEAMRGMSRPGGSFLVSAFDLSRFKNMCDLGGGTGDVAYAACNKYPDMKISVFELPPVVQCSSHFRPSKEDCPNQHNVTFVGGDFFKGPLPPADLYVMTRVIHDWGDKKVDLILKNTFDSLPSGGGIIIGELLVNDDKTGPFFTVTYDLLMLVICGNGARERSGLEYKQLLEKHGFHQVQYKVTGSNSLDAIFAVKP